MQRVTTLAALWLYRRTITRWTAPCPQTPSCSEYAEQMVRQHGARLGLALALARTRRERL